MYLIQTKQNALINCLFYGWIWDIHLVEKLIMLSWNVKKVKLDEYSCISQTYALITIGIFSFYHTRTVNKVGLNIVTLPLLFQIIGRYSWRPVTKWSIWMRIEAMGIIPFILIFSGLDIVRALK